MLLAALAPLTSLLLPLASAHVVARGCGGHDLIAPRAIVTDVASSKENLDPTQQCAYYNYQPAIDARPRYPTIWTTAQLVAGDNTARDLFASINATVNQKVGAVAVKPATGVAGYTYDRSDPDCWWSWQGCTTPAASLGIANDVVQLPEPMTLGLTLDDGPNCSQNALYDFLRTQNQKASLFFIGSNVMGWPLQAIRALQDGHEICVHTWSHQPMTSLTNEQAFAELYYTRQIIKEIMGVTPKCWRPPQGDVDNRIRVIAQGLNLTNILWSDDTNDWRAMVPNSTVTPAVVDANYQKVIDQAKNGNFSTRGAILLSHQSSNYTMSTFINWLPQLKAAFAHVMPVASGLNWTQPYAEGNIAYPDFAAYIRGETNSTSATAAPSSSATATASSGASAANNAVSSASRSASGTSSAGSAAATTSRSAAGPAAMASGVFPMVSALVMVLTAVVALA